MSYEDYIVEKLGRFNSRLRIISAELQLKGMKPEKADEEARIRAAAELEEAEAKINVGVLHIMKNKTNWDGKYHFVTLEQVYGLLGQEYISLQVYRSDIKQVLDKFVEEKILDFGVFDVTKEKYRFKFKDVKRSATSSSSSQNSKPDGGYPEW